MTKPKIHLVWPSQCFFPKCIFLESICLKYIYLVNRSYPIEHMRLHITKGRDGLHIGVIGRIEPQQAFPGRGTFLGYLRFSV